jgi:hypothetical protein
VEPAAAGGMHSPSTTKPMHMALRNGQATACKERCAPTGMTILRIFVAPSEKLSLHSQRLSQGLFLVHLCCRPFRYVLFFGKALND